MSPVVIGSLAALDAAVLAQIGYALRDYQQRRLDREGKAPATGEAAEDHEQ